MSSCYTMFTNTHTTAWHNDKSIELGVSSPGVLVLALTLSTFGILLGIHFPSLGLPFSASEENVQDKC